MLRRWLLRIITNYSFHKWYWWIRSIYQHILFRFGELIFRFKTAISNTGISINIFWRLFKSIIGSIALAIVALLALLAVSRLSATVSDENRSSYDSLLFGIASVAGVFLGFYFTSLNTVAGSLYAKMPERIRELLFEERVNNLSTNYVVFLTVLSASLLGVGVLFDYRPKLAVFIVLGLGFFAILIFVQLSKRVFFFFDPTSLSNQLFYELYKWHNHATISGHLWNDPSFQDHYRQQAYNAIEGIKALVAIAHQEDHLKQEPLARLLSKTTAFISSYIQARRRIPTNSRWYSLIHQHKAWYLADFSAIDIATSTSTHLQPELKPDTRWIEKELLNLEIESLNRCLNDKRHIIGLRIIDNFERIFSALGDGWMIQDGQELLHRLYHEVNAFTNQQSDSLSTNLANEQMGCIDHVSLLPIHALIAFFSNLEKINLEHVRNTLARLKWEQASSIYTLNLPVAVLERLETIQKSLDFEKYAEGRIVSPTWYYTQLVIQPLGFALKDQIEVLVDTGKNFYLDHSKELLQAKKTLQAVIVISRGLEFYNKAFAHLLKAEAFAQELDRVRRIEKLGWPAWNWPEVHQTMQTIWDTLVEHLAQCIPELSTSKWSQDFPDYFGKAVHTVGEECFNALLNNKANLFARIFPIYSYGAFIIFDKLRAQTDGWHNATAAVTAPVMDLIELSGYAMLFAELHQDPSLWQICTRQWEKYLQPSNRRERLGWLSAVISYNRSLFAITPRSIIRTNWQLRFNALLRALSRKLQPRRSNKRRLAFIDQQIVDHPSLLIRVMGGHSPDYLRHFEGTDVFVDLYLAKFPEAKGIQFGIRDSVQDAIERFQRHDHKSDSEIASDDEE